MQAHIEASGHQQCNCGGYHYPHRPGSPYCERNAFSPVLQALRAGATEEEALDIAIDLALDAPGRPLKRWPFD